MANEKHTSKAPRKIARKFQGTKEGGVVDAGSVCARLDVVGTLHKSCSRAPFQKATTLTGDGTYNYEGYSFPRAAGLHVWPATHQMLGVFHKLTRRPSVRCETAAETSTSGHSRTLIEIDSGNTSYALPTTFRRELTIDRSL